MLIGFRSNIDDFLDDVKQIFIYDDEDDELNDFILLFMSLEDREFVKVLIEAINIEIRYRSTTSSDFDGTLYEQYEIERERLTPKLTKYDRKGQLEYTIQTDQYFDFSYAMLCYLEYWVDELSSGVEIDDLCFRGDRVDVIIRF